MLKTLSLPCLLIAASLAAPAWAQPAPAPAPAKTAAAADEVQQAIDGYKSKQRDLMVAAAKDAMKSIDVSKLNVDQISRLMTNMDGRNMVSYSGSNDAVVDRLVELSKDTGPDGARAALKAFSYGASRKDGEELAVRALTHPQLKTVLGDQGNLSSLAMLGRLDVNEGSKLAEAIPSLAAALPEKAAGRDALAGKALMDAAMASLGESGVRAGKHDALRQRVKALAENSLAGADAQSKPQLAELVKAMDSQLYTTGLIGNPAPALAFEWASEGNLKSLDDLKGKVVVLDFWATWCGPCVASFPKVRAEREHYSKDDVAIVGVTSLQGYHMKRGKGIEGIERIDTKGDPQKEYSLMPEFMQANEMTWTVVFAKQPVFNPDYGITGIPHVAILDVNGNVRYRGLHPSIDQKKISEGIDALLREAGKKAPGHDAPSEADEMKK